MQTNMFFLRKKISMFSLLIFFLSPCLDIKAQPYKVVLFKAEKESLQQMLIDVQRIEYGKILNTLYGPTSGKSRIFFPKQPQTLLPLSPIFSLSKTWELSNIDRVYLASYQG